MCLTCRYYNRFGLFRQAPLVIYFQIFSTAWDGRAGVGHAGSACRWTLSRRGGVGRRTVRRWTLSRRWGASAGGVLAPGWGVTAHGRAGEGRQESVTQQCPAASGSHPRQTLALGPISPLLAFQFAQSYPPPLSLGPLLGSPHQQKFFNINKV